MRYRILHDYGLRSPPFFRALRVWSPLIPLLMDHVLVEIYDPYQFAYGVGVMGLGLPIEARLRAISVALLYEVCRVQKIDINDLSRNCHVCAFV